MSQTTLAALLSHHGGIPNPDSAMALAEIIQSKGGLEGALNEEAIAKLEKIGEEQAKILTSHSKDQIDNSRGYMK